MLAAELRQRISSGHHAFDSEPVLHDGRGTRPRQEFRIWKASNPQGYRVKFERRAALVARFRRPLGKAFDLARADADIEPYPENRGLKGILRRIVQITKRHRDVYFIDEDQTLAPLSIIITTLASRAYEYCVTNFEYDDELDLVCDVVRKMPP